MSGFWSAWITILTLVVIFGCTWLLLCNRTTENEGQSTGHSYDGIEELDNPLPYWWFLKFLATVVFSLGYLVMYPGLGSWQGLLGWSQVGQWEQEMEQAQVKYGPIYAKFASMPIEQVAQDAEAMKMGQRLFADNCAVCHGSDAKGSRGFPNLTDNDWLYGGEPETIKQTITHGRMAAMPAWGSTLGEQGVDEVASYVMSLSGREADSALVEKGAASFQMLCSSCHGADGKGNHLFGAPNLTDDIWLYGGSPSWIKHSIRNGRNGRMPAQEEQLSADKIHLLSAYVYSLSM